MRGIKVGDVFGMLTVKHLYSDLSGSGRSRYMALCTCSCGIATLVERCNLPTGNTQRCPICTELSRSERRKTHGNSHTENNKGTIEAKSYSAWQSMKSRCSNPNAQKYSDYGARGISVCSEWIGSYESFLADMGLPPDMECQIDRINNDGNYEKENCRWVSRSENGRNKRNNVMITAFGKTQTQAAWASEIGIKRETISMRIKRGYSPEEALSIGADRASKKSYITPAGQFASIKEAADHYGLSISGAHGRFKSDKYPEWISS